MQEGYSRSSAVNYSSGSVNKRGSAIIRDAQALTDERLCQPLSHWSVHTLNVPRLLGAYIQLGYANEASLALPLLGRVKSAFAFPGSCNLSKRLLSKFRTGKATSSIA
jgi:hypothetical protein